MEHTDPTQSLSESHNAPIPDDVLPPSISQTDENFDDETVGFLADAFLHAVASIRNASHIRAAFLKAVTNRSAVVGFPASFDPIAAGNCPVDGFPEPFQESIMHEPLGDFIDDYFQVSDDDSDGVMEQQPALPPVMSWRNPNLFGGAKTLTCIACVSAFWSILCFLMAFRVNKTGTFRIGPGSSLLLQPNRFFVETINVEQEYENDSGPILYGFNNQPPLNVVSNWSELHYASLQANVHKDWNYFLNEGSQINISYSVHSSRLLLTITRGSFGYDYDYDFGNGYIHPYGQSLYDQSGLNTLSWNIIQGNGIVQHNITESGKYYINVENLNLEVEEVELNISGRAFLYDTDGAHFMCMLGRGRCVFNVLLLQENHAVLATPRLDQGLSIVDEWHMKLSYSPRWITLFGGVVVINGMILIGIQLGKKYNCIFC